MNKEQLYETIEAYLEGKLTEEARRAFEKEIAADPELRKEVALHQRMQQELGKSEKAALREQLRQIAQEFPLEEKRRKTVFRLRPWAIAVAAAIIGAVIWWAWPRFTQPSWQEEPGIAADSLPGKPTDAPDSQIAAQPEPGPKPEETAPSEPERKPSAPQQPADPFRPNPKLEELAANESRDAGFLVSAEANAVPAPSDKFRAVVAGMLRSGKPAEEDSIVLYIYDNQLASYQKEQPAAALPLELKRLEDEEVQGFASMNNYTFEKKVEKDLPPGLYYYVIKRKGEDTPLFVGKVEVGKKDR
ncbi:MAG: hypothetical protein J5I94_22810 [Phaeodactylibacter sp.]|nr:hypothetical protein [Phaeodactylibacter sp.]